MRLRTTARCCAVQALYQLEVCEKSSLTEEEVESMLTGYTLPPPLMEFAKGLVLGYLNHKEEIDELISNSAYNWNIKRMTPIDRNIIRVATYEMLFEDDIPPLVSINEAIELAKKYSTRTSGSFVNGVLDSIRKSYVYHEKKSKNKQLNRNS